MGKREGKRKMRESVDKLTAERDRLLTEMVAIKNRIAGLELAMSLLQSDEAGVPVGADTSKRGNAKGLLIDLLKEAGTTGLNAVTAVEVASRRGIALKRGTAAATLSRMKADGIVVHDGDKYRLPDFSRQPPLAIVPGGKSA